MDFDLLIDDIDDTAFSTANEKAETSPTHHSGESPTENQRTDTHSYKPRERITAPSSSGKTVPERKTNKFTHRPSHSRKPYNRIRRSPTPPKTSTNFQLKRRTTDKNEIEGTATAYTWYLADGIEPVKNILKECREEASLTPTTSSRQEARRENWTLTAFCLYPLYRKRPRQCSTSIQ